MKSFSQRTINDWNNLPANVADAPSQLFDLLFTLSVVERFAFNVFYSFEAVALLKTTFAYRFFNKRLCVRS